MIGYIRIIMTFLLLLGITYIGFASDIRIMSLGNARLVLLDRDNDLNLYNFIQNPAYLLKDDKQSWLKFYGGANYYHTTLKREFDPDMEQNLIFDFEGYKILSDIQAIWGRVDYNFNNRYHIANALDRNPYAGDPVLLSDTTSGNFYTDGPRLEVGYNIQPLSRLGFGAQILYEISTGLKKQYTRPRTIHRNFETKIAFTYSLSKNISVGSYLNLSFLQDQIELVKSWDGKEIHTLRYRSELVYRSALGSFDRYKNLDGWHYNAAVQYYSTNNRFQNLFSFDYYKFSQEISDHTGASRHLEPYWYQNIYHLFYYGRLIKGSMVVGISAGYHNYEDWSEHPDFPIMITQENRKVWEIGGGLSYQFSKILFAVEGSILHSLNDYNDHQSILVHNGNQDFYTSKLGIEYNFDPIHQIRLGFNYDYFYPDYYSPRYLPEYRVQYFSFGLAESRVKYEIEFHLDYVLKNAIQNGSSFNGWNALIYTRLYMF
jgi:hypothetical protein